ncbi:MAG: hypothetical protein IPJ85_10775 [Flavobacteriales bacterium]|nr:hypothetical protein [Flavobacteriales bacterium]
MNNSGFGFKGVLNASGMELQVENGTLEPHRFLLGEMSATNMTLMGSIPVNATRPAEFGYDAVRPQPAWYVVVTSRDENVAAATISGQHLDGIPDNRNVPITSVWLYSNGQQEVALRNGIPGYSFFDITQFHLQSVLIGPTVLTLSGELELGVPGIPTFTTALLYNKTPNGISGYTLQDFAMPPVGLNGVQLAFNKGQQKGSFGVAGNQNCITFAQGQLTIKGVISDQDPNVFKNLAYTLVKTNQQTKLTVDRNPQQSVRLGGDNPASRILMTDVEGEMTVVNGSAGPEWNTFYIKGNMPADMGFEAQNGQPQRMRFEVRGDLAVENQQVKLKDIETPFGNINMVYDMQHHRLCGQLNVSHGVSNGPSMSGAAAIVIDKEGFYFMSGLNVSLPDPQITGMAFILLGDYAQRTRQMDALLMQYSLHVQKKMEREIPAFLISPCATASGRRSGRRCALRSGPLSKWQLVASNLPRALRLWPFQRFLLQCRCADPAAGDPQLQHRLRACRDLGNGLRWWHRCALREPTSAVAPTAWASIPMWTSIWRGAPVPASSAPMAVSVCT